MSDFRAPNSTVSRVLMTGDTVGGVWSYTLELAQGLGSHGIEVILATLGGEPTDEQRAEADSIPNLRLLTSRYKLEWMDEPWRDVEESGRWLLGLEKQFGPDVIHLNSYGHGSLPWQAPVVLTAHSCVLSWWAAVKRDPIPARWNRYRHEVERSVKAADLLTAPSRAMLRMMEEIYGAAGQPLADVRGSDRSHDGEGVVFGAAGQPLADARGSDRSHDREGMVLRAAGQPLADARGSDQSHDREGVVFGTAGQPLADARGSDRRVVFRNASLVVYNGRTASRYRASAKEPFVLSA